MFVGKPNPPKPLDKKKKERRKFIKYCHGSGMASVGHDSLEIGGEDCWESLGWWWRRSSPSLSIWTTKESIRVLLIRRQRSSSHREKCCTKLLPSILFRSLLWANEFRWSQYIATGIGATHPPHTVRVSTGSLNRQIRNKKCAWKCPGSYFFRRNSTAISWWDFLYN